MFYKNISNSVIYVQTPRGRVIEIPPSGVVCGKWFKFKKAGLVGISPEEVDWSKVVWYPTDPLEDIELPEQLFQRITMLREGKQLELTDYKAIVLKGSGSKEATSGKKDKDKQEKAPKLDLQSMSYNDLLQLAKEKKIELPSARPKKVELIELLEKL